MISSNINIKPRVLALMMLVGQLFSHNRAVKADEVWDRANNIVRGSGTFLGIKYADRLSDGRERRIWIMFDGDGDGEFRHWVDNNGKFVSAAAPDFLLEDDLLVEDQGVYRYNPDSVFNRMREMKGWSEWSSGACDFDVFYSFPTQPNMSMMSFSDGGVKPLRSDTKNLLGGDNTKYTKDVYDIRPRLRAQATR